MVPVDPLSIDAPSARAASAVCPSKVQDTAVVALSQAAGVHAPVYVPVAASQKIVPIQPVSHVQVPLFGVNGPELTGHVTSAHTSLPVSYDAVPAVHVIVLSGPVVVV